MSTEFNSIQVAESTKKRVLFLITQSEFGGAQRFLLNLIPRLDPKKYAIEVASGQSEGYDFTETLKQKGTAILTLPSLTREINFVADFRTINEIRNAIKDFKPDVLFLCSSKAGFLGSLAAKFSKPPIKVIYRIGGWTFNDPWPSWKKWLFRTIEKLTAGWKNTIILNNEYDFGQAEKYGIKPRDELAVVANGLDIYKLDFLPADEARKKITEKIGLNPKVIIGTIANLYPTKGLKYLIDTAEFFKNDPGVVFVVIGNGENNNRRELETKIKDKGLEMKVFLMGQIPDAYKYLNAFDIFVLPSVKEGFPWSLIEAMAAKLPVIATKVGAVPEIIQDGKNGFIVPPADPASIANAIRTILESSKTAQELGIQAHQRILFKYDLDRMVSQIEELIN